MSSPESEVMQADDHRFAVMSREDWAGLDAALADDMTYVHSTARLESKAEHMAALKARKPWYRSVTPRDRRVRVNGNVGLINGIAAIHVENDGKENRFTVRYLAVYSKSGATWRLCAWQSTRMPDA
jgi:ketosteroid isomerase-like protein